MKRFGILAFALFLVLTESHALADTANIQATDTVKDYWIPLIAAFVGAIIGGAFVLIGTYWANCHSLHRDAIERQKNVNGILRAIKNELEILGEVYSNQIGKALEFVNEGEVFSVRLSLQNEYFIVYPKNTHLVGQIDDAELVKSIIFTYSVSVTPTTS